MRWTEERGKTTKDYKKRVRKLKILWKEEGERSKQLEREEIPNTQRQMKGIIEKEVKRKGLSKLKKGNGKITIFKGVQERETSR